MRIYHTQLTLNYIKCINYLEHTTLGFRAIIDRHTITTLVFDEKSKESPSDMLKRGKRFMIGTLNIVTLR